MFPEFQPVSSDVISSRALRYRRHRIDIKVAAYSQFLNDSVAKRLIVRRATNENYLVNIARRQARLINRRPRSFYRLRHKSGNRRVVILATNLNVKLSYSPPKEAGAS